MTLSRRRFLRLTAGVGAVGMLPGSARAALAAAPAAGGATWLAGDLHCHTTASHDVGGGPTAAPPTDPEAFGEHTLLWGWTAGEQIGVAEGRGLDFLAVTDHNTVETLRRPDYASDRLVLLPGYEHSLAGGHAGVFVASVDDLPDVIRDSDGSRGFAGDEGVARFVDLVHERGGLTVLNHPFYGNPEDGETVAWQYGTAASLGFDGVEVWNGSWAARHDIIPIADFDNHLSLPWWEREFLPARRMPLLGGSDNHFRATTPAAGVGQPTTWVLADDRSPAAVLRAIRAGRTAVSAAPPALGGVRLDLHAIENAPGATAAGIGGSVRALVPLDVTVTLTGPPPTGQRLRLVSTGQVVADVPAVVGTATFRVTLPEAGWLRAELYVDRSYAMTAVTSPIDAAGRGPVTAAAPTEAATVRYGGRASRLLPLAVAGA